MYWLVTSLDVKAVAPEDVRSPANVESVCGGFTWVQTSPSMIETQMCDLPGGQFKVWVALEDGNSLDLITAHGIAFSTIDNIILENRNHLSFIRFSKKLFDF